MYKHYICNCKVNKQNFLALMTVNDNINYLLGNDPSTDLRGCGMLGLLTVLHFVASPTTKLLASKIYNLSRDEIQNFPFSVMSINITRIALQILRTGKINKWVVINNK